MRAERPPQRSPGLASFARMAALLEAHLRVFLRAYAARPERATR